MNKVGLTIAPVAVFGLPFAIFGSSGGQAYASGPCSAKGLRTLATGKADYHPEETVDVSGSGYNTVCDVSILAAANRRET